MNKTKKIFLVAFAMLLLISTASAVESKYLTLINIQTYNNYYVYGIGYKPENIVAQTTSYLWSLPNQGINIQYRSESPTLANPSIGLWGVGSTYLVYQSGDNIWPTDAQQLWIKNNYPNVRLIVFYTPNGNFYGAFDYPLYRTPEMELAGIHFDTVNHRPILGIWDGTPFNNFGHAVVVHEWGHSMGRNHDEYNQDLPTCVMHVSDVVNGIYTFGTVCKGWINNLIAFYQGLGYW